MIRERIYIGGLDPPRLTATDILRRLRSIDQIEIFPVGSTPGKGNDDDHLIDTKPYLHLQAISKEDGRSALDMIAKQYHNVKWKGCKLAVEAAKPHFLERLEEERRQRATGELHSQPVNDSNDDLQDDTVGIDLSLHDRHQAITTSSLPRRLRVRKKFGEEAFHIDTTPWTVLSWNNFNRARVKSLKRVEKHRQEQRRQQQQQNNFRPQKLMHRAVHIRFSPQDTATDGMDNGATSNDCQNKYEDYYSDSSTGASSQDDSSPSLSLPSSSGKSEEDHLASTGRAYQWSDDDEDSDEINEGDQGETENGPGIESMEDRSFVLKRIVYRDENCSLSDKESGHVVQSHRQRVSEHPKDITTRKETDLPSQDKTYCSLMEEEDTSQVDESVPRRSNLFTLVAEKSFVDEFSAGFADDSLKAEESMNHEKEEEDDDDEEEDVECQQDNDAKVNLQADVMANLNILSSLFPEMNSLRPAPVENEDGSNKGSIDKFSGVSSNKNIATIMPRFDPTLESSKKYVIEDTSKEDMAREDRAVSTTDNALSDGKALGDEGSTAGNSGNMYKEDQNSLSSLNPNIYEQNKLESVFRDARMAWEQQPLHTTTVSKPDTSGQCITEGFSFGFSFNDVPKKAEETSPGFSFSFYFPSHPVQSPKELGSEEAGHVSAKITMDIADMKASEEVLPTGTPSEDALPRKVRRGFDFPREDLLQYANNFFSLNNGKRIMADPDGFQNDEQEKEAWNQERQTLTQDWKRKRKYAMSRIHKRLRN
jgi:hypothetical protein